MNKKENIEKRWRHAARSRLKFELAGLALAKKAGLTYKDYAEHLWSDGAQEWMGKTTPGASEYLLKEAEAFSTLYPEVRFETGILTDDRAELTFTEGCLGGCGQDRWALAIKLGLAKKDVCHYCRHSFRIWARQLGLEACPEPQAEGKCVLRVHRKPGGPHSEREKVSRESIRQK